MPIYEFYCPDCHRIFNFLARRVEIEKRPPCPRCGRAELSRRLSRFAVSKGRTEPQQGGEQPKDVDEAQIDRVLADLERESEGMSEDDPRHMARMMRRLYDASGMPLGPQMEEAMRRMESGEDPDRIEEEMGDLLEAEDPSLGASEGGLRRHAQRFKPPEVDDTLYDL